MTERGATEDASNGQGADGTASMLRDLELRLLDAAIRSSPDEVAALLDDGFREFGSSGRVHDKAETVRGLSGEGGDAAVRRVARDVQVRMLADSVALVTYRAVRSRLGAPDVETLRSSAWTCSAGRWRMLFYPGTPTAPGG